MKTRYKAPSLLIAIAAFLMGLSAVASAWGEESGKHLFILSGQSNMTGPVQDAFAERVQARFDEENAVVVMRMKSGRGIRFWVADYLQPTDRGLTEKKMSSNGQEYKPLIEAALAAAKDQSFDTVGFIWMQGESDANNRLSEVYEKSFVTLIKQLKKDLGRDDLYFVIGRINDYAQSRPDNEHWHRVRESQVRLGNTSGNAWIDTDDLNGGDADQPDGDIHFPREGAVSLGQRFADEAIELIDEMANGERLRGEYVKMLAEIEAQVAAELPRIDPLKKVAFETARAELAALKAPREDDTEAVHRAFEAAKPLFEAKALDSARPLIADLASLLASDVLDSKLMKAAILRHGTPAGLAEFAQQGEQEKALLDKLFADEALMKQILKAGGANGGEYGEAMQVYTAILEASELAREPGILQRLALGTALQQPWLDGKDKGSVNGIVFADHTNPDGQVARYLHYEQAYLAKELDAQFKDFNAWECRFITNDPYTNEELTWGRAMLRQFRPDHITNPDQKWRYTRVVKSDLPYCSTRHDDTLGLPQQQALALGGICGRRAFFGRFIARAFGIPSRRSTQTGHAAMNRWTPDGWVNNFGGWWSFNWCGPQGGLDFYLDSQAREHEEIYMQVLRAQWIGDALGQEDVSLRHYGQGGGFWDGLAFYKKRAVVEAANLEQAAADAELAALSAEEARLLGESDKVLGDAEIKEIEIPEEDKKIVVADDGTITVPAVACTSPKNNTDKVAFLKSWNSGMQLHYQRLGNRPEILRYTVEAPVAGKYELTLNVSTVSKKYEVIARLNRRTLVNTMLPYTKGSWQRTEPETIELREGRNTIQLTFRAPNRGVSIKEFQLKPVK